MRTISISTEVFAEIWRRHKPSDTNEDDILRRVFQLPAIKDAEPKDPENQASQGYEDPRYRVSLPENFEIYRTYKGREFRARATGGQWLLLTDKKLYPSLHKLSWAVVNGHE